MYLFLHLIYCSQPKSLCGCISTLLPSYLAVSAQLDDLLVVVFPKSTPLTDWTTALYISCVSNMKEFHPEQVKCFWLIADTAKRADPTATGWHQDKSKLSFLGWERKLKCMMEEYKQGKDVEHRACSR